MNLLTLQTVRFPSLARVVTVTITKQFVVARHIRYTYSNLDEVSVGNAVNRAIHRSHAERGIHERAEVGR